MPELRELLARSPWSLAHASGNGTTGFHPSDRDLAQVAAAVRKNIVIMTTAANSGHPGGSLSATDLLVTLYGRFLRHDPHSPRWPERDRFVMSGAHKSPVVYATLAEFGFLPTDELLTFRRINSRLQGHTHIMTPGVEFSGGALGQGLSYSIGMALAGRIDGAGYRVYCMVGDGECDEGQIWEAAMSAAHHRVDNVTVLLDRNGIQNDRFTHEVMNLEPLADKWRAFGWHIQECDGHDFDEITNALEVARGVKGQPSAVIAHTVKGKGVSFMENNPAFHGKAATMEELERALAEIDASLAGAGA